MLTPRHPVLLVFKIYPRIYGLDTLFIKVPEAPGSKRRHSRIAEILGISEDQLSTLGKQAESQDFNFKLFLS